VLILSDKYPVYLFFVCLSLAPWGGIMKLTPGSLPADNDLLFELVQPEISKRGLVKQFVDTKYPI
jgi:hypothetical protein